MRRRERELVMVWQGNAKQKRVDRILPLSDLCIQDHYLEWDMLSLFVFEVVVVVVVWLAPLQSMISVVEQALVLDLN